MISNFELNEFTRNFYLRDLRFDNDMGYDPVTGLRGYETAMMVTNHRPTVTLTIPLDQFERLLKIVDDMDPGKNAATQDALDQYLMLRNLTRVIR
jgi:hypothetical protein